MFSTVPLVRQALVDLFRATLNQPGDPKVAYGKPDGTLERYVSVWAPPETVQRENKRFPFNGTNSIDEDYPINFEVWSLSKNRHGEVAEKESFEDAYAIAARLDAALRADYELKSVSSAPDGSQLVTWAYITDVDVSSGPHHEGRATQIVASVTVKAAGI